MNEIKFQVFGSHDSVDIDVIIFMASMPSIENCKRLCIKHKETITKIYKENGITLDREVDINLGVLENGTLITVFKGSSDEVNNSLYYTYHYHEDIQLFSQQITSPVKRNVNLKMLRSSRIILSLLSRTKYRDDVKDVLTSDFISQIELLKKIDFSGIVDFGTKNGSKEDIYKRLVFQMGQTIALSGGFDLYSKSSIAGMFPSISRLIYREELTKYDLIALNELKERYTTKMSDHYFVIGKENEKSYFLEKNIA